MALYPYTLQPVALNMSEDEFHQAQRSLFQQSAPSFGLSAIKMKEWIFIALAVIIAVAGLIFVTGYSTIMFWLILVGVVAYLLLRTLGMKWYVGREFDKQMAELEMPEELNDVKLGVQKNGLIMSMPTAKNPNLANKAKKGKKGMSMQMQMPKTQQAVIPWSAVTSWDETNEFVFVMFEMQGQKGSQIIPKRLKNDKFPIESVIKHLNEVKEKGIEVATVG